ncbi:CocE/NonD family hydrolase [Nocardia sp. NPDC050630]|uniref:CocE/NonD family hydrolase n=1 Tax=Nocardia sp. NPDC050630 TaxID=3364321 RepID=UPI0037A8CD4C
MTSADPFLLHHRARRRRWLRNRCRSADGEHRATTSTHRCVQVRLCDVDIQGISRNIVDGIVRAVATPGEFTEQVIDLWSTSHVFCAGHRIRVHVTSSNFPRWDRNLNTGEPIEQGTRSRPARQEIAHNATQPSRIVLPVIPAPTKGQ